MRFWKKLVRNIVVKVVKPEIEDILSEALTKARAAVVEVQKLKRQLASIQALDARPGEVGKLVLLAEVGGKPRIRIWEVQKAFTTDEYRMLSDQVQEQFGARKVFVDCGEDPSVDES